MIIVASERSGAIALAKHLTNQQQNDHVTLHELRGFIAEDLHGAMKEASAVSRGCPRLKKHLFSVSLNPPEKVKVTISDFEDALERLETKLGLTRQARATVFHEKEARIHLHAVYSRVDVQKMRAINLAHFKRKLQDVSRELYQKHDWKMPRGLIKDSAPDSLNFTLEEWQQAKRSGRDPKSIKSIVQECWQQSDGRSSFQNVLVRFGFLLAKGDRRGFVAVDWEGNTYAISRWVGVRAREVRDKLGKPDNLPTVDEAKAILAKKVDSDLQRKIDEQAEAFEKAESDFIKRLQDMRRQQREDRGGLEKAHETERRDAIRRHADLLPIGLRAVWFRLTGQYGNVKRQIERAAEQQMRAQAQTRETLIRQQLLERQALQRVRQLHRHQAELRTAEIRVEFCQERHDKKQVPTQSRKRSRSCQVM